MDMNKLKMLVPEVNNDSTFTATNSGCNTGASKVRTKLYEVYKNRIHIKSPITNKKYSCNLNSYIIKDTAVSLNITNRLRSSKNTFLFKSQPSSPNTLLAS